MNPPNKNALRSYGRHSAAFAASVVSAIALATILMSGSDVRAALVTWTNTVPDYFTNSANWDSAAVPGSADTADVANNGTVLYTAQMTNVIKQMLLGGSDGSSGNVMM